MGPVIDNNGNSPVRKPKRVKYRIKWWRLTTVVLVLLALVVAAGGYAVWHFLVGLQTSVASTVPGPGQRINILVIGVDAWMDTGPYQGIAADFHKYPTRSDTLMLVSIDPTTGQIGLLSIPRDLWVSIPGHGHNRINAAHAFGGPQDGPALAMQTVQQFLGVPVHYYVRTNFQGFQDIVDLLGGITVDVEKRLYYVDKAQGLYIDLQPGVQVLDGQKALEYVRFRHDAEGDLGRIRRQQQVVKALMDKLLSVGTVLKIPQLEGEITKYVDTNMPPSEIMYLATLAMKTKGASLQTATYPGTPTVIAGADVLLPDTKDGQPLVDKIIWGLDYQANQSVTVEVLNGTGMPGKASEVAKDLSDLGFAVARTGTASGKLPASTVVLSHVQNDQAVQAVARALERLGIDNVEFQQGKPAAQDEPMITITLGTDLANGAH